MARRRYYRYPRRTVAAKKKWATNFRNLVMDLPTTNYTILVENKTQNDAPTPTIIKTGNFKVQGDCRVTNTSASGNTAYMRVFILFVPEGWALDNLNNLVMDHPEWIMAWTVVDMPYATTTTTTAGSKFSMSSRLKRNLNSGDRVVFYARFSSESAYITGNITGAAQYWTCAN